MENRVPYHLVLIQIVKLKPRIKESIKPQDMTCFNERSYSLNSKIKKPNKQFQDVAALYTLTLTHCLTLSLPPSSIGIPVSQLHRGHYLPQLKNPFTPSTTFLLFFCGHFLANLGNFQQKKFTKLHSSWLDPS